MSVARGDPEICSYITLPDKRDTALPICLTMLVRLLMDLNLVAYIVRRLTLPHPHTQSQEEFDLSIEKVCK